MCAEAIQEDFSYNDRMVKIRQGELTLLRRNAVYYKSQFEIKKRRLSRLLEFLKKLKADKRKLLRRIFGKKSEASKGSESESKAGGKKRGKQKGAKGSGRKTEDHLATTEEILDLPEDKKKCSCCGLPFIQLSETSDSEIIEVQVKAHCRVIKRKRYKRVCNCPGTPGITTAPCAAKVIPKGKFGVSFWVYVLLHKFYFQTPLNRVVKALRFQHLKVSSGTIVGGFDYIANLFLPLYQGIEARNRSEHHWHADETRWLVFAQVTDKVGNKWYLWVFKSETSIFFKMAKTRGQVVVQDHLAKSFGIINVDRYSSYKTLLATGRFLLAYCWVHVRRDFVEIEKSDKTYGVWAAKWVVLIGEIFHVNKQRIAQEEGSEEFEFLQTNLEELMFRLKTQAETELVEFALEFSSTRRSVLNSLLNHWHGLNLFVKFPWIPMDNNPAERQLRDPVCGRKAYYGSGSVESAMMAAYSFSIFATLDLWQINVSMWTKDYLQACAENGGKPPENVKAFLPWHMSDQQLKIYGSTQKPEIKSKITKEQIRCATVDEVFQKKKSKLSKKLLKPLLSQKVETVLQRKYAKGSTGLGPTVV